MDYNLNILMSIKFLIINYNPLKMEYNICFLCQFNPYKSIIIDYNGFFRDVIHETYNFFKSYLFSCSGQFLHIFHKMLHFTLKKLFTLPPPPPTSLPSPYPPPPGLPSPYPLPVYLPCQLITTTAIRPSPPPPYSWTRGDIFIGWFWEGVNDREPIIID